MAPEQSRGKPEKASDQYALGIMVYEWLCGKPPFCEGHAINIQYQHAYEPVPPLSEQLPTLLPAVEQVIMRALVKDSKGRFATVEEFVTALTQGISIAPPQPRVPIQAKPVPVSRPQPIRARPVSVSRPQPIRARPVTTPDAFSAAFRAGLQHLTNKNYVKAIEQFIQAQQQEGSSYDVLYNLGRAYQQYAQSIRDSDKKQFNEHMKRAADYFDEASRQKTDALDAYFQLGMCYRDLERPSHAITAFKKVLALDPQDPAVYYQLGQAAMKQNSYREAESYFQDGLKIKPGHPLILIAQARLYMETKQVAFAIKQLRWATQQDSDLWEGWYELGRAHMKQKEWKYALSALERARQITGYNPEIYSAMATCYLKINQKADAGQKINEILQHNPHHAEAIRLKKLL